MNIYYYIMGDLDWHVQFLTIPTLTCEKLSAGGHKEEENKTVDK